MKRASILSRFIALLIDMTIVTFFSTMVFIAGLSGYSTGSDRLTLLGLSGILFFSVFSSALIFLFYFTYLTMGEGMTIGKSMAKIRVINRGGIGLSARPGFFRALVRAMAYILSASICFLGFIMAFFLKGRALHDIIAGTQVVTTEEESA